MKSNVRLLYFQGCPNVEEARRNLAQALQRMGRPPEWTETDVQGDDCPPEWRGFPSPTVLVDGRDVATGESSRTGAAACRFGGPPSVELIVERLRPSPDRG